MEDIETPLGFLDKDLVDWLIKQGGLRVNPANDWQIYGVYSLGNNARHYLSEFNRAEELIKEKLGYNSIVNDQDVWKLIKNNSISLKKDDKNVEITMGEYVRSQSRQNNTRM